MADSRPQADVEVEDSSVPPISNVESNSSIASAARRFSETVAKLPYRINQKASVLSGKSVAMGTAVVKAPYNIVKADHVAKFLCKTMSRNRADDGATQSAESVAEDPEQSQWEAFSKWLQTHKLKSLALPAELKFDPSNAPSAPAWGPDGVSQLARVSVLKRFNSRKQPHLIEFENTAGQTMRMIYKQDDDIRMDVCVMKLFEMCNEVWARRGLPGYLRTYKVVACPDLTGFGEIVPGDTMLHTTSDDMVRAMGNDKGRWMRMFHSLIGVVVSTAIFDITDRHHNNVLFTPECELALIDLSASLGKEAPLDKALRINPIYIPERVKGLRDIFNSRLESWGENPDTDMRRWSDLEEAMTVHYFAIYNDRAIEHVLSAVEYKLLKPHRFLALLHERKHGRQVSEGVRNNIVGAMDESDAINSLVAGLTRVVPMN